ncbi:MAG: protein phosphatase 2C domain-containing protein, partial [Verrucomicrobiota bacterium]
MIQLETSAITDIGKVRSNNEDRYLLDDTLRLYGVADGIGGLPGGEQASQRAVDTVSQHFQKHAAPTLAEAVNIANQVVGELGERLSPGLGIGTTLTVGRFADGALELVNVGDSRCYRLRQGELTCLTEDDSVENDVRRRRAAGELVFLRESQRHALTQCIGQPMPLTPPVVRLPLEPEDLYLFATDGITGLIPDHELA